MIRAALVYANGAATVSHTSALNVWQLPAPDSGPVHLTTTDNRHLRGTPLLKVHRRDDIVLAAPGVVQRQGVPVIRLDRTIVDSWPVLDGDAKRAPAIIAVNNRMATPARLSEALDERPRVAGRRLLANLIELMAQGCRSHLELWAYAHVFRGPRMPSLRWQVPVSLGRRTVYLDAFDEASGVNFEMDGAAYHSSPQDRERDLRRDSGLAAMGIVVVRFTPKRLLYETELVRDEAIAITNAHRWRRDRAS